MGRHPPAFEAWPGRPPGTAREGRDNLSPPLGPQPMEKRMHLAAQAASCPARCMGSFLYVCATSCFAVHLPTQKGTDPSFTNAIARLALIASTLVHPLLNAWSHSRFSGCGCSPSPPPLLMAFAADPVASARRLPAARPRRWETGGQARRAGAPWGPVARSWAGRGIGAPSPLCLPVRAAQSMAFPWDRVQSTGFPGPSPGRRVDGIGQRPCQHLLPRRPNAPSTLGTTEGFRARTTRSWYPGDRGARGSPAQPSHAYCFQPI